MLLASPALVPALNTLTCTSLRPTLVRTEVDWESQRLGPEELSGSGAVACLKP